MQTNANKMIAMIVVAILIAGGAFYAGMKYDQSTTAAQQNARRQQFGQGGSGGSNQMGGLRGGNGGGAVNGEILSIDPTSITVKMRDGGSKIVFFSGSTQISKTATGSAKDLVVGEQVMATGTASPDGSISAQMIQVRPAMPTSNATTRTTNHF
jgi:hypothetical protein